MPLIAHDLALALAWVTTIMTVAGMGYMAAAMIAAQRYLWSRPRRGAAGFAPGVSVMKSLKGVDPEMMEAFRSHCRQQYAGEFELLFGVSSLEDPAAAAVEELGREFPAVAIRLIECPEQLGANGKVSTLAQMAVHARYDYLLINDSDITVSARYLERVMARFASAREPSGAKAPTEFAAADVRAEARTLPLKPVGMVTARFAPGPGKPVGLVTALYRGRAHGTLAARLEALGIATDFMPGVLVSRMIEGGLRFGLGSTLAVSREALEKSGGLLPLVD
ncbi:MAG TPA: glycosyltransferase, partial [Terracidiphilus sp.]